MRLRDYQQKAHAQVLADLAEADSALVVMATGLGKTITFGHVANHYAKAGRVMILAHREELIRQAADKVGRITNRTPDIEMAGEWADKQTMWGDGVAPIVVSSVQTQIAGMNGAGRMTRFNPNEFSLVIIDEAHHAPADSYKRVIAHYRQNPNCKVLGVTATPDRTDEAALGQCFDRVSFVFEINDGIDAGWLVPVTQRMVHVDGLDFSRCRTTAGDLNGADLAAVMEYESNLHGIAHPAYEIAAGRKTLVFAASVGHAERLSEILNRHKPGCARFICGATDDVTRRRALRAFKSGDFQFLVNCMVFTEGFDEPTIEVVAVARPTKSRSLYCQMVGRGTRPLADILDEIEDPILRRHAIAASGKPSLEVIDFVGNAGKHKLMTTADILGGNYPDAVVELAERKAREADGPVDMKAILEKSEEELERRRQEAERRRLADAATRVKLVGYADYSTSVIDAFNVLDIAPAQQRGWDKSNPATEKQIGLLRKFGIDGADRLSRSHATQLIGNLLQRSGQGKCSWKQAKLLRRYGYDPDMPRSEAKRVIDELAKNGWRRPAEQPREAVA